MAIKYWARLIPEDVAKRSQVVFATDYDALAAELRLAINARDYANDMLDRAHIETAHHSRVSAGLQMRAELAESRIVQLESALREAMEWDWLTDPEEIPEAVVKQCAALTASETEAKQP